MPATLSGSAAGIFSTTSDGVRRTEPQQIDRFGACELFAEKARDKAAAANFASSFHAPQGDEEIAPGWSECFSGEQIAEDDSPAQQQLTGEGFGPFLGRGIRQGMFQNGPSSGSMARHFQP